MITNTDLLPKKLSYFLLLIPIVLFLWLGGAFTLLIWKGDTIYSPSNSYNLTYKVPVEYFFVTNKFGEKIEILTSSAEKSNQAIFLYLHGNVGRIPRLIEEMSQIGMVISPAYPGFSGSEGNPSTERLYDTVDTTLSWLITQSITPNQITVIGHSMGGATVVYAANQYPELKKLILVGTFYSIQSMCEAQYTLLCALSGNILNSSKLAPEVKTPIRQFHHPNDQTVPYAQGKRLYELFGSKDKKFIDLKNVNSDFHNGFSISELLEY